MRSVKLCPDNRDVRSLGWSKPLAVAVKVEMENVMHCRFRSINKPIRLAALLIVAVAFVAARSSLAQNVASNPTGELELVRNFEKGGTAYTIGFSPDSAIAFAGGNYYDGTARLYEVETGQEIERIAGDRNATIFSAISPDGRYLAACGRLGEPIRLYDLDTLSVVHELSHPPMAPCLVFSADNRTLATGGIDKTIRFWDVESGKQTSFIDGHEGRLPGIALSPDGLRIASASDKGFARVFDIKTGAEVFKLKHPDVVWCVQYSPDGRFIATGTGANMIGPVQNEMYGVGTDNRARLWDARTGDLVQEISGHSHTIRSLAFSPDGGRLVTASLDKTVRVWDLATGDELARGTGRCWIMAVAVSPNGQYALCGGGNLHNDDRSWTRCAEERVRLFRMPDTPLTDFEASLFTMKPDGSSWQYTARAPNYRLQSHAACSPDGETIAWQARIAIGEPSVIFTAQHDGTRIRRAAVGEHPVWLDQETLLFERDGQLLAIPFSGGDERLLAEGRYPAVSPDGTFVVFSRDGQVLKMNADGSELEDVNLLPPANPAHGMSVSHKGERIAYVGATTAGGSGVYVAHLANGMGRKVADEPQQEFFPQWSADDRKLLFTAGGNYVGTDEAANRVYVVDLTNEQIEVLTDGTHQSRHASWLPGDQGILVSSTRGRP